MKLKLLFGIALPLAVPIAAPAQTTLRVEAESAIIWSGPQCKEGGAPLGTHDALCDGIATTHPEATSLVQDPLSGDSLRKINYEGIEVSSTLAAFDVGCGWSGCYTAYVAKFTIINDTEEPLVIDGASFQATLRAPTLKEIRKLWGKKANPADFAPRSWSIGPGRSAPIAGYMVSAAQGSTITRWFNNAPVDVVPVRYSIRVRGKDFVFPWLAPLNRSFPAVPQWDY